LMKFKFLGLMASLIAFSLAPAHATTYLFDTPVSGTVAPAGTVDVTVNGSTATFVVALPSGYSFNEFALNLLPGETVSSGAYTVSNSGANFGNGFSPFNTALLAHFGNTLTFSVSNYVGLSNITVNGAPIWFVAAYVLSGGQTGAFASDAEVNPTPLPAALPLFAGGLGIIALLGIPRSRRNARTRLSA